MCVWNHQTYLKSFYPKCNTNPGVDYCDLTGLTPITSLKTIELDRTVRTVWSYWHSDKLNLFGIFFGYIILYTYDIYIYICSISIWAMRTPANSHRFLRCRSWSSWKESAWRHARCHLPSKPYFLGFIRWGDIHTMISMFGQRWGICTIFKKTPCFFPDLASKVREDTADGVQYNSRQFNWGFLGTFQWFYVLYKVVLRSSLSWLVTVNLGVYCSYI